MNILNVSSPLFRCALGIILLALFGAASSASVIYQYREPGSTTVIGTLEVRTPPASPDSGWSTADSSDLISLFLDDGVFHLGPDNLLAGTIASVAISSVDGSKLDGGQIVIVFPTLSPPTPTDPTIDRIMELDFLIPSGADGVGGETLSTYPDGVMTGAEWFPVDGDWTAAPQAAVPEPGTFALLGTGLPAARRSAFRRRR